MTQEEVMTFLVKIMAACLWMIGITATILIVGFSAGYVTEKFSHKDPRCINAACDTKCKPNARFVRHEGCEK